MSEGISLLSREKVCLSKYLVKDKVTEFKILKNPIEQSPIELPMEQGIQTDTCFRMRVRACIHRAFFRQCFHEY